MAAAAGAVPLRDVLAGWVYHKAEGIFSAALNPFVKTQMRRHHGFEDTAEQLAARDAAAAEHARLAAEVAATSASLMLASTHPSARQEKTCRAAAVTPAWSTSARPTRASAFFTGGPRCKPSKTARSCP